MPRGTPADMSAAEKIVSDNLEVGSLDDFLNGGEGAEDDTLESEIGGHDSEDDDSRVSHTSPDGDDGQDEPEALFKDLRLPEQGQQQQRQPQPRRQDQPQGRPRYDNKGNVIDQSGRVIARAGAEARLFNESYRAKAEVAVLRGQTSDLETRLTRAVEIGQQINNELKQALAAGSNQVGKQLGLSDTESVDALQLAKAIKDNPVEGLKKLLTRAAVQGIDLTKLGLQGGFDPSQLVQIVRDEIGKATKPITEQSEAQKAERQAQENMQREITTRQREATQYFTDNPDLMPYMDLFYKVYEQGKTNPAFARMSLGEVGARIRLGLLQQQYQNGGQPAGQSPRNGQRRGIPNGRARFSAPGDQQGEQLAPVTASYDEILRDVLNKHMPAARG